MRIIQLITGLNPAGAERVVSDLSRGLAARGHDVEVVSLMPLPASPIVDELAAARIPVRSLDLTKTAPWRLFRLPGLLDAMRPHLVHAHMFHANLASRIPGRGRTYRVVNTVHIAEPRLSRRWLLLLDRLTRERCDRQTVVSEEARAFHAGKIGIPPDRMPVIYNGIRPPRILNEAEIRGLRTEWGMEDCDLVLGAVGRLVDQKGFDILLRILPAAAARVAPARVGAVILGDGPRRRALADLAGRVGGGCRIRLPGFRPDAADCMGAFDSLVVPSRFEGFGLVLVEGMAHGIPILASRIPPLVEVGRGYDRVRYVEFREDAAGDVAAALKDLMEAGRTRTPFVPFTIEAMVDGYLHLYESLLPRASGAA
jgi:glycosyltransferase involved in cell wall biosynthesis